MAHLMDGPVWAQRWCLRLYVFLVLILMAFGSNGASASPEAFELTPKMVNRALLNKGSFENWYRAHSRLTTGVRAHHSLQLARVIPSICAFLCLTCI